MSKLNERGHEILDETPMALPIGFKRPPTIQEQIQAAIRTHLSFQAAQQGKETFEEADDFDVGDDFDPSTPYEMEFDPAVGKEITRAEKAYLDAQRRDFDRHVEAERKKPKRRFEEEQPDDSSRRSKKGTPDKELIGSKKELAQE